MLFSSTLDTVQTLVHQETELFFNRYIKEMQEIDEWSAAVAQRLQEYSLRSGKALRPLLVLAGAAVSASQSLTEALERPDVRKVMLTVEFTHKRLLMADDVADQDELRHQKPAFHILFEQDLGKRPSYAALQTEQLRHIARSYTEVAGIWYQQMATQFLVEAPVTERQRVRLMEVLFHHVYEMTPAGWYILFDQNFDPVDNTMSEDRFLKGLELVTGEYSFVAPLLMGAALGEDSEALRSALIKYGRIGGLLHQVTDDVLGVFGDPAVTGKPAGNDLREGKKTLLVQYSYSVANEKDRQFLHDRIGKPDLTPEEVERAREIIRQTGALRRTEEKIAQLVRQAQEATESIHHPEVQPLLQEIVEILAHRKK